MPRRLSSYDAQIATAYAPGVLMTWEGGRGICKSVPIKRPFAERLPKNVSDTIFEGVREFAESWRRERSKAAQTRRMNSFLMMLSMTWRQEKFGSIRRTSS